MKFNIDSENSKKQFEIHIFRAKEDLKEAEILFEENSFRGAVSRAYYGFFEAAHAALITKGITAKTHAGVIAQFSLSFIKTKKIPVKFIRFFKEAEKAREEADYQFLKEFKKEEAENIIKTTKEFIEVIEKEFSKK